MLAKTIPLIGSRHYEQRGPGAIVVPLPACKRLQDHVRTLLGYKTSKGKDKFHIVGNIPLVTKAAWRREFRGHLNSIATYNNLMARNTTVQQLLTFQLRGRDQAVRSAKHSTAQNGVVDTFPPDIPDNG